MKLLFAIKGLYCAAGGAERVICDVCSFLAEQGGHEVSLLTLDSPGTPPFYSLSPRVRLLQLGLGDPAVPTTLVQFFRRMVSLRRVVKSQNPEVVVSFMHSMFIPMSFALAGLKVPLVASEHTTATHYRAGGLNLHYSWLLFLFLIGLQCYRNWLRNIIRCGYVRK